MNLMLAQSVSSLVAVQLVAVVIAALHCGIIVPAGALSASRTAVSDLLNMMLVWIYGDESNCPCLVF